MTLLEGKVAVITGAGAGLGREIAIAMAGEKAMVVVASRREENGRETVDLITREGNQSVCIVTDVESEASVKAMVDKVMDEYGHIDILVNNAGIIVRKSLLDHTLEDWEKVLRVDLTGTFLCSKYVAPHMIVQKKGKIINIASIAGLSGYTYPSYGASKAGVVNLTRGLAWELGPHGINVNCVCPGLVRTALNQHLVDSQEFQQAIRKIPQRRLGFPREVADTCIFLASDRADYFNGAALTMDGGSISYFNFFE